MKEVVRNEIMRIRRNENEFPLTGRYPDQNVQKKKKVSYIWNTDKMDGEFKSIEVAKSDHATKRYRVEVKRGSLYENVWSLYV